MCLSYRRWAQSRGWPPRWWLFHKRRNQKQFYPWEGLHPSLWLMLLWTNRKISMRSGLKLKLKECHLNYIDTIFNWNDLESKNKCETVNDKKSLHYVCYGLMFWPDKIYWPFLLLWIIWIAMQFQYIDYFNIYCLVSSFSPVFVSAQDDEESHRRWTRHDSSQIFYGQWKVTLTGKIRRAVISWAYLGIFLL